jgi:hypothetical protein
MFPLPNQTSWTVFHLNCKVVTRVYSALQTKPFALDDWRRLPKVGRHVGKICVLMSNLWEQTRVRCLTGFAQQTRTGFYGQRQQV